MQSMVFQHHHNFSAFSSPQKRNSVPLVSSLIFQPFSTSSKHSSLLWLERDPRAGCAVGTESWKKWSCVPGIFIMSSRFIHTHCSLYPHLVLFLGRILFHGTDRPHFVHPFVRGWASRLLPHFGQVYFKGSFQDSHAAPFPRTIRGTSLVVPWLGICLVIQRMQVRSHKRQWRYCTLQLRPNAAKFKKKRERAVRIDQLNQLAGGWEKIKIYWTNELSYAGEGVWREGNWAYYCCLGMEVLFGLLKSRVLAVHPFNK